MEKEFEELIENVEIEAVPEIQVARKSFSWINEEVASFIIEKSSNEIFSSIEKIDILGKGFTEWVSLPLSTTLKKVLKEGSLNLENIKEMSAGYNYVFIVYNDVPLLQRKTFFDVMDYFAKNNLNSLALKSGFVFKREFLQNLFTMESFNKKDFGSNDFLQINSEKNFTYAFEVLKSRVIDYHRINDVVFLSSETTTIDADVKIESGVVIYPNNVIKGKTLIGENSIIKESNVIVDSVIEESCVLSQTRVVKSKVKKNSILESGCVLNYEGCE